MREARTKAPESYLAGVVYSTCRVDLSRFPGPGRYINDIGYRPHTLSPKSSRHILGMEHSFSKVTILALCYSILLWSIWACQLSSYLVLLEIDSELI